MSTKTTQATEGEMTAQNNLEENKRIAGKSAGRLGPAKAVGR
jgi:hypothetical protein